MKYCQTLKPGFYFYKDERCIYASGSTTGNQWIDLTVPEPRWNTLLWNCIEKYTIDKSIYHEKNPTKYEPNMKSTTIIVAPTWGKTLSLLEENKTIRIDKSDTEKFKNILDAAGYPYENNEDGKFERFTLKLKTNEEKSNA